MSDTVKSWIEERQTIQGAARPFTEADPDDFEKPGIFWESADRERVEANITASNDGFLHFPRALNALEDLIGIAHLMDEEAREYEHEGRVLAAQIARGHAASIRSAIESALEDGNE